MNIEAKKLYNALSEEGVLKQVYGKKMTGSWEKDSKLFMEAYNENEKLFGLGEIDCNNYLDETE